MGSVPPPLVVQGVRHLPRRNAFCEPGFPANLADILHVQTLVTVLVTITSLPQSRFISLEASKFLAYVKQL